MFRLSKKRSRTIIKCKLIIVLLNLKTHLVDVLPTKINALGIILESLNRSLSYL